MVSAAARQQKVAGAIYQIALSLFGLCKTGPIDGTVNPAFAWGPLREASWYLSCHEVGNVFHDDLPLAFVWIALFATGNAI